jgi:hypothetical protein
MEALQKLDELLNKAPEATTPRVANPAKKANSKGCQPKRHTNTKIGQPKQYTNTKGDQPKQRASTKGGSNHSLRKDKGCAAINNRARISQRHQMNLRQSQCNKRAQLIHNKETGEFLNYRKLLWDPKHRETWEKSAAHEFGRLAQNLKDRRVNKTNTIFFISKDKVPKDRTKDVTYRSFSCDLKPNKTETHCTSLTAGRDRVNYPGNAGTPTADMTLFKILMNSIISTEGARWVMVDIKDFYLCMPMKRFKYMRL